jgi:hypothetical protein
LRVGPLIYLRLAQPFALRPPFGDELLHLFPAEKLDLRRLQGCRRNTLRSQFLSELFEALGDLRELQRIEFDRQLSVACAQAAPDLVSLDGMAQVLRDLLPYLPDAISRIQTGVLRHVELTHSGTVK